MAKKLSNKNQALLALGAVAAIGVFLYTRKKPATAGIGKLKNLTRRQIEHSGEAMNVAKLVHANLKHPKFAYDDLARALYMYNPAAYKKAMIDLYAINTGDRYSWDDLVFLSEDYAPKI